MLFSALVRPNIAGMPPGFSSWWSGGRRDGRWAVLAAAWVILSGAGATLAESPPRREPFPQGKFSLENGDVVAFVGGADVVAAQQTGHLETLLAVGSQGKGVRFRNFGWEGDTVFAQPRDVGFPPLSAHLQKAQASVVVMQFGRTEAMAGRGELPRFLAAYRTLLGTCAAQTPRLVLATPVPFESGTGLMPDLSLRNVELAAYAGAIRELARERVLPLVDLFSELGNEAHREPRLTENGLQLTPRGHALVAATFVRQLGLGGLAERAGPATAEGAWPEPAFERLRQVVLEKNRLWFQYWRPQNWAFLGGDRTSQPSSRDHRDPALRWFPAEMEKFLPLIAEQERLMQDLAGRATR
jgi:hypothetical protein